MKTTGLFLIICTLVLAPVTGSAKTVKETRNIGRFTKINAQSGIDVYFTQGNLHRIEIETDDELMQKVRTETKGETLSIGWNSNNRKNIFEGFKEKNTPIKVYVTAAVLNEISASGGVDFYLGDLNCDDSFKIHLSGAADAYIDNLNVNGNTHIAVSGGAGCTIKSLQAKNGDFSASGSGDIVIRLNVSEHLSVSASGGSKVKLNGNANTVSVSASGGADIDVRKLKYNQIESRASGGGDIHK